MARDNTRLGFPAYSTGLAGGSGAWGTHFDEAQEEEDKRLARAVDAALSGLSPNEKLSVHVNHLGAKWHLSLETLAHYYLMATNEIEISLKRRNILI